MSLELEQPPEDTIQDLAFSTNGILAAASWDGSVTAWQFNETYSAAQFLFSAKEKKEAVLRVCWDNSNKLYFGTSAGAIKTIEPKQSPTLKADEFIQTLGNPIVGLKFNSEYNVLIAATLNGSIHIFENGEDKELFKDKLYPYITNIGTDSKYVYFAGYSENSFLFRADFTSKTPKAEPIQVFPDLAITSFALGSNQSFIVGFINGQITYGTGTGADKKDEVGHRSNTTQKLMYTSNAVAISPERPVGISGGSDGNMITFNFSTKRSKPTKVGKPITAIEFTPTQGVIAYATGNDWSEGAMSYYTVENPSIMVKKLTQADLS